MEILLSVYLLFANVDMQYTFDYKTLEPYQISFASPEMINKNLKGTYLQGCGDILFRIEWEQGVNHRFIYAIGKLESGNGKYLANVNNYFGIKNTYNNDYRVFNSKQDCLYVAGEILGSKFYKNRTIENINKDYCPNDLEWSKKVKKIMREI